MPTKGVCIMLKKIIAVLFRRTRTEIPEPKPIERWIQLQLPLE